MTEMHFRSAPLSIRTYPQSIRTLSAVVRAGSQSVQPPDAPHRGDACVFLNGEFSRQREIHRDRGRNRKVAQDFTFSGFKSAPVPYALFEDTRILQAFYAAVLHTIQVIESNMHTRIPVGKSTINEKTGSLVAAPFTHFLSRPTDGWADPHLHTHMVAFNSSEPEA